MEIKYATKISKRRFYMIIESAFKNECKIQVMVKEQKNNLYAKITDLSTEEEYYTTFQKDVNNSVLGKLQLILMRANTFKAYDSISKIEYGEKFSVFKMVVGE